MSNGCLGLFLTSILLGGVGLGLFYRVLCILAWYEHLLTHMLQANVVHRLVFLITSIMEVSLVCIFNHLQNELRSRITMQEDLGEVTTEIPIQRPLTTAIKQKTPHVRRVRRNVTVESVEDSADVSRNPENQDMEDLSSIAIVRRQDPTHSSQATTIAEILQEPVSRPRT
ncbi:hypothetical protein L211DRAFT_881394 [Terfezia boudieri ATCC MYA-4762]|uniref:Uncharacterized protein n=1 Tax=Terfezia boudieri ATCC MYA-4762 TaxID=1051890 RepID=A0A3N4M174_9PEZI|nr:hypothetical protein L211DRAFT_881394 [Terfezia boudieri ATCC MYA-4762]